MKKRTPDIPLGWLQLEDTLDSDYRARPRGGPGTVPCIACERAVAKRRYRVYTQRIPGLGWYIVPLAYDIMDDEYDETNWHWIGPECKRKVPDGYLDVVLDRVQPGDRVQLKGAFMVKAAFRGQQGVVIAIDNGPNKDVVLAVKRPGLLASRPKDEVLVGIGCIALSDGDTPGRGPTRVRRSGGRGSRDADRLPRAKDTTAFSPVRTALGMTGGAYVPEALFGVDHWSTLGYIASVIAKCDFFQVGFDAKMRQGRQSYRVMHAGCIAPKRPGKSVPAALAMIVDDEHGSRLVDGTVAIGHDDWHCVQDLAEAGFFELRIDGDDVVARGNDIQPGAALFLTEKGSRFGDAILAHDRAGRPIADFVPPSP